MSVAVFSTQSNFALAPDQVDPTFKPLGDGGSFQWDGVSARTYFIQTSSDSQDWSYLPEIDYGDSQFHYGFETSESKFFLRIRFTDVAPMVDGEVNPEDFDFDGDGLPSLYELLHGLDPFDPTSGPSGLLDGDADREMDGRIDGTEMTYPLPLGPSHPSKVDNPKVKLVVEVEH